MTVASSTLLPPGGQRIMAVLAHPDDGESLCGGTIARLAAEGCTIRYLIATRGDKGSDDPTMTSESLMPIREQEQYEAAKVLGVQEITFLDGYYDGTLEPTLELRQELTLAIRQWRPDVVFTFDPWKLSFLQWKAPIQPRRHTETLPPLQQNQRAGLIPSILEISL